MTEYISEFDDIPGTRVFTAQRAKQGYQLNQFCMSLMKPENRERFKAGERAYLDEWPMTEAQKQAVLDRDYNRMLDHGGNKIRAARALGMSRATIYRRIREYGIVTT